MLVHAPAARPFCSSARSEAASAAHGSSASSRGASGRAFPTPSCTWSASAARAALYRRAWVFASPSTYEGFGLPYLEAMASGTPVVATPNVGSVEVLDGGRFGCLADDETFAQCICELLGDGGRREALADAGLRRAGELSLDRTVDAYEAVLLSLATARR
jgi:glycosyltransferase involved in cell wall biosynthesis